MELGIDANKPVGRSSIRQGQDGQERQMYKELRDQIAGETVGLGSVLSLEDDSLSYERREDLEGVEEHNGDGEDEEGGDLRHLVVVQLEVHGADRKGEHNHNGHAHEEDVLGSDGVHDVPVREVEQLLHPGRAELVAAPAGRQLVEDRVQAFLLHLRRAHVVHLHAALRGPHQLVLRFLLEVALQHLLRAALLVVPHNVHGELGNGKLLGEGEANALEVVPHADTVAEVHHPAVRQEEDRVEEVEHGVCRLVDGANHCPVAIAGEL
mmetsp:Transcript_14716/g.57733  ORF Transcript_14716/g.57733 Transcript_14716/m.57733 type:complete len:266 (-) Transcript_14716:873-1670(-)